jgi:signal transduction histidine kinase
MECSFAPLTDASGQIDSVITILADVSEQRRTEVVTGLSTTFANVAVDLIDEAVKDSLRIIGEFARVDRAYIFRITSDDAGMSNTHEWCAPGVEPQIEALQGMPLDLFPWWTKRMKAHEVIMVPDVHALPPEAAAEKENLLAQDIQSVLAVPMTSGASLVGLVGFDSVRTKRTWTEADVTLLRIASEIFVSALERQRAEQGRKQLETQLVLAKSLENVARLAGGVAHDFNTLLGVILNYATVLQRELTDPGQKEKMSELFEAARRASELTRQLLMVGRRDVVAPVLMELDSVVESLSPILEKTLGKGIELKLERGCAPGDLRMIEIGMVQLEQVIVSLLMNAREAMGDGGTVTIRTENFDIDERYASRYIGVELGSYVRMRVTDTGAGMTPDVASRAFEPFFTTKGASGSGLGLSTVHGIVKRAGGHVAIASQPGAGTSIDVLLPEAFGTAPVLPATDRSTPVLEAPPPSGRGKTVLVVEDSDSLRKIACTTLSENGYRVLDASNAEEALKVCERQAGAIDVLLTDVLLPKMSGRALADVVRKRFSLTRVVYMTGFHNDEIARHGVLEEGTHLLQKPFLEGDLLRAVSRSLEG